MQLPLQLYDKTETFQVLQHGFKLPLWLQKNSYLWLSLFPSPLPTSTLSVCPTLMFSLITRGNFPY